MMQSLQLRAQVDAQGQVVVPLPAELADQEVDLVVVFAAVDPVEAALPTATISDWPEGFFEATAGRWQGEPLVRQ